MSGPIRRFDPGEVRQGSGLGPSDAELAEAMVAARELETLIARDAVGPTVGFEDRVMAAIATEPAPRLFRRPATSVRGWPAAFLLSIRDAWRVATGGGRPFALRAQAMAFVLLVILATGSVSLFAVGASGLLDSSKTATPTPTLPGPSPSIVPSPSPSIVPSPSPSIVPSPSATPSATPSQSAEPSESAEPTETAEPTGDDSSGPGGGGDSGGGDDSSGSGGGDDDGEGGDDSSGSGGGGDSGGGDDSSGSGGDH